MLEPSTIRRVVPVTQSQKLGRGRVTCISAELYEDCAYIDFWVYPPTSPQPPAIPMLGVKVTDDRDTSYRAWSGGGTGIGPDSRWRMGYIVRPAVPDEAAWIELSVRLGHLPERTLGEQDASPRGGVVFDENDQSVIFRIPLGTG